MTPEDHALAPTTLIADLKCVAHIFDYELSWRAAFDAVAAIAGRRRSACRAVTETTAFGTGPTAAPMTEMGREAVAGFA